MIRLFRDANRVGEVIAGTNRDHAKHRPFIFRQLHDAIDDFVDCSVAAHGDDHFITLFAGLLCKFGRVRWIYCSAPVRVAIVGDDGT